MRTNPLITGLLCAASLVGAAPTPADDSTALRTAVTVPSIRAHQAALQAIADANGGTRAVGTPGFDASLDYVRSAMLAAGYTVTVQNFSYPYFEELSAPVLQQIAPLAVVYPPDNAAGFSTMTYSGSGDVTAPTSGVDLVLPPGAVNSSTSGCEAADFAGFPAGDIAIIQRGSCAFSVKAMNAEAAGAVGVILFNEGQAGRTDAISGTLTDPGLTIPVVGASFAVGEALAGPGVVARVRVDAISELRPSANLLAETPGGAADSVVVVGAHLDSVVAGPGINDNGSGVAATLEIARQIAALGIVPVNKVRFAWWGAEELGVGSSSYLNNLTPVEFGNIALNLDVTMIGSPNFATFVLDGDGSALGMVFPPGSGAIEQIFLDYFGGMGLPTRPSTNNRHASSFAAFGIPSGGIFGGAEGIKTAAEVAMFGGTSGDQYDPCFHLACDTFDNVSLEALDRHSDAAAHAILTLAASPDLSFGCEQSPPVPSPEICFNGIDDDCDGLIDLGDPDDCSPMLVDLESFTAEATPRGVQLRWRTALELDNAGFRILTGRASGDPASAAVDIATNVITPIIPPQGSAFRGADYEYVDGNRQKPGVVYYFLEDIDLSGHVTRHGPVVVEIRGKRSKSDP